ncbi:hypothetical protein C8A00DRAFT_10896 [Chaetomidium leptoderma]|uniref:Myb-like domain-containing protein n=1 Tax=Chaetomidium leptoderma TaxID=669021 RepID=A0AAN6VVG9_9PEZI|nr:hypothetical protein C8A00DRAFT_10896 [Chaetomidium leptoderma]
MLNKKSAFKPKAAIRRPAPGSAPQSAQRPSTTERSSNNTPAPQESSSSSSQPHPAPHPAPSAPLDANAPALGNGTRGNVETLLPVQEKQAEPAVVEPAPRASITSTPAATVPEGRDERATATAPTETLGRGPATGLLEKLPSQESPTVKGPVASGTPAADTGARRKSGAADSSTTVTATAVPTSSTDSTASNKGASSSTQTSSTAPTIAPVLPEDAPAGDDQALENQPAQAAAVSTESATSGPPQPTTEAASEPAPEPTPAAKPKRGRKRTTTTAPDEDAGEQGPAAPPKKRLRKRAAPLPGEEGYQPSAPRATRSRKRRESEAENGEAEEDGEENTGQPKKKLARPQREATPPDAEAVEIDITQVKMADLAKDMHIGKKFSLHDELMERERAKRLRYNERRKRQQNGEDGDEATANGDAPAGTPASDPNNTSAQATPAATTTESATAETPADDNARAPIGETYQIIDGEIVLDHRSLQVDRHARAREEAGELVEIEENDFTNHTTSATYLRRNLKPQQWTDEETDLFYQALQAFGTDFDTICRMFKGKTRKHIKLKFNREERVSPQRINAALVGQKTVSFDMDQYQRATGQEYETAEAIYAEQKRAEDEFEARQKALEDEKAEEVRRKKEEVLAQLNSVVDGQNQNHGGGGGGGKLTEMGKQVAKRGRKKKGPPVMGL